MIRRGGGTEKKRYGHEQSYELTGYCSVQLPLGSTGIGRDNDAVLVIRDVLGNVLQCAGLGVEVIDGDIEETLDL